MAIGERPRESVAPPAAVRRLVGSRSLTPVWRNELGGLTFRTDGHDAVFIKWAPTGSGLDLEGEAERLAWAIDHTPVPIVLDHGSDREGQWLVTRAFPGTSAVDRRWVGAPATAVTAIGRGLRALHDALPVEQCPFDWSAQRRLDRARQLASEGAQGAHRWHDVHQDLEVADALALAGAVPPVDLAVVCHGDACAPNTLLDDVGDWIGHVDCGAMGVADRWADLAVATWSTAWNYGPGWEDLLLEAYGVDRDEERMAYYRLLWDLT